MELLPTLAQALAARRELFDARHEGALRLFNGFTEGYPELSVECFGRTLLLYDYREQPQPAGELFSTICAFYRQELPWLSCGLLKTRAASEPLQRNGRLLFGDTPARRIREHGVSYALDLALNRDASFYLDTRSLRAWLLEHMNGKRVLNCFAYTGSLGVAAQAGGAAQVVQLDRSRTFLNLAKTSYTLNGLPIIKADFRSLDFFAAAAQLRRSNAQFDCVILDPPFFSQTSGGRVDLVHETARLINKARPLVADNGWLVAINNALFVPGATYLASLEQLCADSYMQIEQIIAVPADCTGYPQTIVRRLPVDPAPFNHATKIAILRVRRRGG
jgi:23S rRNA (cytosine1962-C5)-methyltransferase